MLKVPYRNNFRFCTGENIGSGGMKKKRLRGGCKMGCVPAGRCARLQRMHGGFLARRRCELHCKQKILFSAFASLLEFSEFVCSYLQ